MIVTKKLATIFIDHFRGDARTDNIHLFVKNIGTFDFFMLDNLKA